MTWQHEANLSAPPCIVKPVPISSIRETCSGIFLSETPSQLTSAAVARPAHHLGFGSVPFFSYRHFCTASQEPPLHILILLLGLLCCAIVFVDAFQTVILPRRPKSRFRLTVLYYFVTWQPFAWLSNRLSNRRAREQLLSAFGPLSLLTLFAVWGTLLVIGFALALFGLGTPYVDTSLPLERPPAASFRTDLYVSGTTLTTLGPGDVVPRRQAARLLMVIESGSGLAFVALVISYVPVLYGAFSRREVSVALLDSRAGSPPSAAELIARHTFPGGDAVLSDLLAEWERWAAELLESHISYPILCYYRSQHDNQSWLAAITTVLDSCALLITTVEGPASRQAQLTFAIARHAVVDLVHVFGLDQRVVIVRDEFAANPDQSRLSLERFRSLCSAMSSVGVRLCSGINSADRLAGVRRLYEAEVRVLSDHLCLSLPAWVAPPNKVDHWRTVASLSSTSAIPVLVTNEHLSSHSVTVNLADEDSHGH